MVKQQKEKQQRVIVENDRSMQTTPILPMPKSRNDVDYCRESQLLLWLWKLLNEISFSYEYEQYLRDGVLLCYLMDNINSSSSTSAKNKTNKFVEKGDNKKQKIENINKFLNECRKYGLNDDELFDVEDLLSMQNMPKVTQCLYTLGRHVYEKNGDKLPVLGKPYDEWLNEFIENNEQSMLDDSNNIYNNKNIEQIGTNVRRRNGMPLGDDIFVSHVNTGWLKERLNNQVDKDKQRINIRPTRDPLIQRQPSVSMSNLKDIFTGQKPPLQYDQKQI